MSSISRLQTASLRALGVRRQTKRRSAGWRRVDWRGEVLEARAMLAANQFAVIGDYGSNSANELAVANMVKSWQPDFIITVGDNNYSAGAASTIDTNIGKYYHDYIGNYTGTFGAGSATNRFFPAMGNTEWSTPGATPYLNYFTLPGNERYYDFVKGPIHFFVVDSDPAEPDGITANSIQGQWLRGALAQSTSDFNLVYFHHPAFSSGLSHGSTPELQWPFKQWGADVVMSGHDHDYERLFIDGVTYFVDGVGGRTLTTLGNPLLPGSRFADASNYGAMLVTYTNQSLTFEFRTITGGGSGTLLDTSTLAPNAVTARQVFYNNSKFDGNNSAANAMDDLAIAIDKQALAPGVLATKANYTSYSRGLNGVMIDIERPADTLSLADFSFRVGNDSTPGTWNAPAVAPSFNVRTLAGSNTARVTLIWPDMALRNQWLEVTVRRTLATGLPTADIFYFGNAVGESGNSAANALVDANDEIAARNALRSFLNPAPIDNALDFNRDGLVNATDQILARSNQAPSAQTLALITPTLTPALTALQGADDLAVAAALELRRGSFQGQAVQVQPAQSSDSPAPAASQRALAAVYERLGAAEPEDSAPRSAPNREPDPTAAADDPFAPIQAGF